MLTAPYTAGQAIRRARGDFNPDPSLWGLCAVPATRRTVLASLLPCEGKQKGAGPFGLAPYGSNIPHFGVQFYAIFGPFWPAQFSPKKLGGGTTGTTGTMFSYLP